MAKSRKAAELKAWHQLEKPTFEALARTVEGILQNLAKIENVPVVSISSRVKTTESLLEKHRRKRYKKPTDEITDFVGIRVITYTEDDASKICEIVKKTFHVDVTRSMDKGQQLEVDQIGYRSFHYVCGLGEKRVALPELAVFKGRVFEVQVRTVLQHAWAEVEHDRNYKFSGVLPVALARRLYLISGLLEVGDRELNQLSRDIDSYAASVAERAKLGQLDDELNSTTFVAIIPELAKGLKRVEVSEARPAAVIPVVDECLSFGLKTTSDLNGIITKEFLAATDEVVSRNNSVGFVRDAMMFADLNHYFESAWKRHWTSTDSKTVELLSRRYPKNKVLALLKENGIGVFNDPADDPPLDSFDEPEWPDEVL